MEVGLFASWTSLAVPYENVLVDNIDDALPWKRKWRSLLCWLCLAHRHNDPQGNYRNPLLSILVVSLDLIWALSQKYIQM